MKSVHFNGRSGNNFNFKVGLEIQGKKKMKKHECCFKLVYMGENYTRQRSLCLGLIPLGKEVIRMICTNSYVAEAF